MREKYKSLSLAVLRELAKARGMKGISTLKKDQLIDRMVEQDEIDAASAAPEVKEEGGPAALPEEKIRLQIPAEQKDSSAETASDKKDNSAETVTDKKDNSAEAVSDKKDNSAEAVSDKKDNSAEAVSYKKETTSGPVSEKNESGRNQGEEGRRFRSGLQRQNSGNQDNRRRTTAFNGMRGDRNSTAYSNGGYSSGYSNGGYSNQGRSYQNRNNQEKNGQIQERSSNQERYTAQERSNNQERYTAQERGGQERYSNQERSNNQERYAAQERSGQERYSNQERSSNQERYTAQERSSQERYSNQERGTSQERAAFQGPGRGPVNQPQPAANSRQSQSAAYDTENEERMREADAQLNAVKEDLSDIDSGLMANGILEILTEGYGFIRSANYLPGDNDVYVSPSQIRRFNLKTGDIVCGSTRIKTEKEKFSALLYVTSVNGYHPSEAQRRPNFEDLTPIFPEERLIMERPGGSVATRVVDLLSPIGKGQRGMIVSPPKAGKTTLLKEIAKSITYNNPEMKLIILLIDERPEEVTDIREAIEGDQVEVIYSTFDETPEHHKRVSEMVIERAKRLVEHSQDVIILLDSITRLARAYNLTVPPSGRTLSGGLDPAALHMPKRFFGAARNMREGGSLTVLATALVDTGSKMDDVVFEEFKGTGNMELVLDRKLSEKRIFPAIDMAKSGTRRDDLLLTEDEQMAVENMRRSLNGLKQEEAVETILNIFSHTRSNAEVVSSVKNSRII